MGGGTLGGKKKVKLGLGLDPAMGLWDFMACNRANEQRVSVGTASRPARVQTYRTVSIGFLSAPTLLSYLVHTPEEDPGAHSIIQFSQSRLSRSGVVCVYICIYSADQIPWKRNAPIGARVLDAAQ